MVSLCMLRVSLLKAMLMGKICSILFAQGFDVKFMCVGMPFSTWCDYCGKVVWDSEPPKEWTIEWIPTPPSSSHEECDCIWVETMPFYGYPCV
jgi:hypothetical protein